MSSRRRDRRTRTAVVVAALVSGLLALLPLGPAVAQPPVDTVTAPRAPAAGALTMRLDGQVGQGWGAFDAVASGADLTQDGHPDVLAVQGSRLLLYPGAANGRWQATRTVGSGWGSVIDIHSGVDVDTDGSFDLLARFQDGSLRLFAGRGDGTFSSGIRIGRGWASLRLVTVVSLSAHGWPAVVATGTDGRLRLYPVRPDGRSLAPPTVLGNGWNGITELRHLGDVDHDGFSEMLAVDSSGGLAVYTPRGSATRLVRQQVGQGWSRVDLLGAWAWRVQRTEVLAVGPTGALLRYTVRNSALSTAQFPAARTYGGSIGENAEPGTNGVLPSGDRCAIPFMPTHVLRCGAIRDLMALNLAYQQQFGTNLPLDPWQYSAFRSYADQQAVWESIGPPIAARPGTSPHGYGLALDWLEDYGYGTVQNRWLAANGPRYHWVRQPWHQPSGSLAEWWHFDYIG